MYIRTLILISIFKVINSIDSDEENYTPWDPNSALIQVQALGHEKTFPATVYMSDNNKKMYHRENYLEKTYAMCPETETNHELKIYCNFGEPFESSRYKKENLNEICSAEVTPAMEKIMNKNGGQKTCAFGGHRYKFVYYLCEIKNPLLRQQKKKVETAVIYDACYHETNKQLVYGHYTITTPSLLKNRLLKGEREYQFPLYVHRFFEHFSNHFTAAHRLYTGNDSYEPQPVLPPELLPFALMRKPLHHLMNMSAMDVAIIPHRKTFMKNLRRKISMMSESITINAGLLDELKDENNNIKYLREINENNGVDPVPEIPISRHWWILIYNHSNENGVVIMMVNEKYNDSMSGYLYDENNCSMTICAAANIRNVIPHPDNDTPIYIFCCYPNVITHLYIIPGGNNLLTLPDYVYVPLPNA